MKKTLIFGIILMLSQLVMAQVINHPSFKARNGSIRNIVRIELTPEATYVYIHAIFRPHWWIMQEGDVYLEEAATGKRCHLREARGIKIGEKTFMPDSGTMDFTLVFEPLPAGASCIHLINPASEEDNTYDISLLPAGKQDVSLLQAVKGNWFDGESDGRWAYGIYDSVVIMNNRLYDLEACGKKGKRLQLTVRDREDGSTGMLRLTLRKDGTCLIAPEGEKPERYVRTRPVQSPVAADGGYGKDFFRADTVCLQGYLDGYDSRLGFQSGLIYLRDEMTRTDYPTVVPIRPDGSFSCKFLLKHPVCQYLTLNNNWVPFYAEPGQTLTLYLSWEDFLARNRARDRSYPLVHTAYMGEGSTLSYLANTINSCFTYPYAELEKAQKTLTPEQFAGHLKPVLERWQQTADSLCGLYAPSRKAMTLIRNQQAVQTGVTYLDYQMGRGFMAMKDTASAVLKVMLSPSFYDFLKQMPLDDETLLVNTPTDIFINRFEFMEPVMGVYDNADINERIAKRIEGYSEQEEGLWAELLYDEVKDSIIADILGTKEAFLWEVVKVRNVSEALKRFESKDAAMARRYTEETGKTLSSGYLKEVLQAFYEQTFPANRKASYQLPEGKATDIFRRIIAPYAGKVLFVDFWGTYCGPCRAGIEATASLREKYRNHPEFQFVYITGESESPQKAYREYVDKHLKGEACYCLSETDYAYMRQLFQFNGIPHYVVVEKDGTISTEDISTHNLRTFLEKRFGK